MSEFDGTPLAVGSVYGVRQWNVDTLGRLTGLTYAQVWRPGENVADCKRAARTAKCRRGECGRSHDDMYYMTSAFGQPRVRREYCTEPFPCGGVDPDCGCGFWAYYDSARYTETSLKGVIEGYGKTTIGTKGFRCEKARIVALCLPETAPPKPEAPDKTRWAQFCDWSAKRRAIVMPAACGASVGGVTLSVLSAVMDNGLWLLSALGLILGAVGLVFTSATARGGKSARAKALAVIAGYNETAVAPDTAALIRRNYPDVEFFANYKAMLAAYPLTKAETPTPETDPKFWDRQAGEDLAPPSHLYATGGDAS